MLTRRTILGAAQRVRIEGIRVVLGTAPPSRPTNHDITIWRSRSAVSRVCANRIRHWLLRRDYHPRVLIGAR